MSDLLPIFPNWKLNYSLIKGVMVILIALLPSYSFRQQSALIHVLLIDLTALAVFGFYLAYRLEKKQSQ